MTGAFYGDMLRREIFETLGMTASRPISDREIVPNRAAGYERRGGTLYNQEWVSPTFNATADGTLYLTVREMEHWDRALGTAAVLKPSTLQQMWTPFPVAGTAPTQGYGSAGSCGGRGRRPSWSMMGPGRDLHHTSPAVSERG